MLIAFVIGIVGGYMLVTHRPKNRYLATAELWVYLPGDKLPDQNTVMDRTIGRNPYSHRARLPIDTKEGLLFSDVRTHIALVLRNRNPHAFRPDLFDPSIEVTPGMLTALAEANSFVKVRYISEDRLPDARHLQFLPHVADAIAEIGNGVLIYDPVAERLLLREELQGILRGQADVSGPDVQARVIWRPELDGGHAETRGMAKMGHRELRTPATEVDQRVLIGAILEETMKRLWTEPKLPENLEIEAFDDKFRILFEPAKDKFTQVRILRLRTT